MLYGLSAALIEIAVKCRKMCWANIGTLPLFFKAGRSKPDYTQGKK